MADTMTTPEILRAVGDAADPMIAGEGDYTATEALGLTDETALYGDGAAPRVVAMTDPDAVLLLVPAGGRLPKSVADALGLKPKKGAVSSASAPAPASEPTVISSAEAPAEPIPAPIGAEGTAPA